MTYSDGFEDWARDLGYDEDSRKALETYRQVTENNAKLCKLFRTTDLDGLLEEARPLLESAGV